MVNHSVLAFQLLVDLIIECIGINLNMLFLNESLLEVLDILELRFGPGCVMLAFLDLSLDESLVFQGPAQVKI